MKKLGILISLTLMSAISFALNPSREYTTTPDDFGMKYEVINIQTEDNVLLYGWFFSPTREGSQKIMIISDDGEGNMSDMMENVSNFLSLGYAVLTYDYRGFGKSADPTPAIKNNFYIYAQFEKDIKATIDYAKKYYTRYRTVHLYGRGIGAGLSIAVGVNRTDVNKIIADSPYSTLESMKTRLKEKENLEVMMPLGYDKKTFEPEYALQFKGSQLGGIMYICGEKDEVVSPKDIKKLAGLTKCSNTTYVAKGASRSRTIEVDKEKYFKEIEAFLK